MGCTRWLSVVPPLQQTKKTNVCIYFACIVLLVSVLGGIYITIKTW